MFCTTCGKELREDDQFCPQCGRSARKGSAGSPAAERAPQKRLTRDMRQKSIGGVCAGFANYLDVDITLVRIIWLCSAFLWGVGFIAYLVCWIVMPKDYGDAPAGAAASPAEASEPSSETKPEPPPSNPETGSSPA